MRAAATDSGVSHWFASLRAWPRRGLAIGAGVVATLAHAPFQLTPLYAVALVILVWLLDAASARKDRLRAAFGVGLWFGLGHFCTGVYWISSAFLVDADAWGPLWGVPAVLGLAGVLALFWAFGAMLAMLAWTRDLRRIPVFAVALFVSEWLRGHMFGGLPWLLPGYVWPPGEPVSQMASLIGIYGLSLLTLFFFAAPAAILDSSVSAGRRFAPTVIAALLIGMMWGWGAQRMARAPIEPPGAQAIIRVADSGLSQVEKWQGRADQEWRVLDRYLEASGAPEDNNAAVVIWPEGAVPVVNFFMLENPEFLDALGRGLGDRVLITGLSRREATPDGIALYNSAAVIDGVSGVPRLSQIYDKNRLVPFGEFIPLWSLVSTFNIAPLQRIGAGFEPGDPPTRLVVPEAPPAVVLICYEAIFPDLIPRGEERPGWIVSVTNDAWFGNGTGPWQHYAMARYRAIEEGLPMARAASGGISAIVDAYGRAIREARGDVLYAEAQLPLALAETPYSKWGRLCVALLLVIIASLRFLLPAPEVKESNP
jgi:apolipoprotein N-acyltransferase